MSEESPTPRTEMVQRPAAQLPAYEDDSGDMMRSTAGFSHAWRVAQMFSKSALIPDHLRGRVEDVAIVLMMAWRLGEDPLIMMQHTHIVKGKAGFSAQYVIARANRSGVFKGRIKYRDAGRVGSPDYSVTAFATLAETGEEISFDASMAMAKAEGWTNNTKYASMPKVMLSYRAATFLVRLNAPDVMLGALTADEIEDIENEPRVRSAHRPELGTASPVRVIETIPDEMVAPIREQERVEVAPTQEAPARQQERTEPQAALVVPPKAQDAPTPNAAAPDERERIKALIDAEVKRLGRNRVCEVMGWDTSVFKPVAAWKHGAEQLGRILEDLQGAKANEEPPPPEMP